MSHYDDLKALETYNDPDFWNCYEDDDRTEELAAKGEERWEAEVEDNL